MRTSNFDDLHTIYDTDKQIIGYWAGNSAKTLQRSIRIARNLHDCRICVEDIPHQEQIPKDLLRMTKQFTDSGGCTVWGVDKKGNCLISWELQDCVDGEAIMSTDQAREFIRSIGVLCGIKVTHR